MLYFIRAGNEYPVYCIADDNFTGLRATDILITAEEFDDKPRTCNVRDYNDPFNILLEDLSESEKLSLS